MIKLLAQIYLNIADIIIIFKSPSYVNLAFI